MARKQLFFGIAGNLRKPAAKKLARRAMAFLQKRGSPFAADSGFMKTKHSLPLKEIRADLFIIFGGDGTLLHVVREMPLQKPVLGFNCGSHGILMRANPCFLESALEKLIAGNWNIEKRARLEIIADGKPAQSALNEVIVAPKKSFTLSEFKVCTETNVSIVSADAVAVATPTGSTAFAFSAGGRKIPVSKEVFEILPVNPFSGVKKPLVVPDSSAVSVFPLEKRIAHEAIIDGQRRVAVKKAVVVRKSRQPALFIRLH